ncbi:MAG: alpha/beta hydrolase [Actinomycetota bacterium]
MGEEPRSPLDALGALASQEVEVTDALRHVEVYTMAGLLTLLWHGEPDFERVVVMCGGAMGGMLGPAGGLYHDLGTRFAKDGIATIRVGYRQPNDLRTCVHDLVAAAELAARHGGKRFVTVGHSFGGAVAIRAAIVLGDDCAGVVTLSTQSAGCEDAGRLGSTPLLLLHGERDELLPPETSHMVQALAGTGEVVILPGTGHLLAEAGDELRERLGAWIPERLAATA